jgi:hypothetical protein
MVRAPWPGHHVCAKYIHCCAARDFRPWEGSGAPGETRRDRTPRRVTVSRPRQFGRSALLTSDYSGKMPSSQSWELRASEPVHRPPQCGVPLGNTSRLPSWRPCFLAATAWARRAGWAGLGRTSWSRQLLVTLRVTLLKSCPLHSGTGFQATSPVTMERRTGQTSLC